MEVRKQLEKIRTQIRELYGKLTASQKVTIGLLTVLVAGAVILLVMLARGETYVKLIGTQDPKAVSSVKTLLEQNGIDFRLTGENGGSLEVPRSRLARARWLAFESGITSAKDPNMEWLFGDGNLIDTPSRIDQRLLESRKRTVEDAIRWSRSIRDVRIVVQQGPEPIYANRTSSSDSAAVAVALRPGLEALSRSEASTIRALVSGAFNIPPANIKITDERRVYPPIDDAAAGMSEEEDLARKKVQSTVEGLLSRYYRPSEFGIGVVLEVSARRSELRTTTFKPDGVATAEARTIKESESSRSGNGDPVGVQPNVAPSGGLGSSATPVPAEFRTSEKKETHNENRFSESQEKIEVPAGELKGLSVNVVLDRAAVRRVLQAEEMTRLSADRRTAEKIQGEADIVNFTVEGKLGKENLDQAVEAHRKAQADFLREQFPMSGAKVNVSAVMFPEPEMPVELAASTRAMGWASEHSGDLLVGGIALVGLWVVWRMFRRAIPPPLDVPPLDETVLDREAQAADEEMARLAAQLSSAGPGGGANGQAEVIDEMLETANSVRELAKSNPEMASAVIRMWMADQGPKE